MSFDDLGARSKDYAPTVRKVIRFLHGLLGSSGGRVQLTKYKDATDPGQPTPEKHKRTTLQVMLDPPGAIMRLNHDDEILSRAEYIRAFVGKERLVVVHRDYGMELRAHQRGLRTPVHQRSDRLARS